MNIYKKNIIPHSELYAAKFTKNPGVPYVLFIHGGPGFNCGTIEYLIEHNNLFEVLDTNIILYDQRNCGRSKIKPNNVRHQDNVNDLQNIIQHLTDTCGIKICGLMGHSYGAKLLFDYYNKFHSTIPGIFVSTANSILIPRLNNLMIDLLFLKKSNPDQYNVILQEMDRLDLKKIWKITEKLTFLFQENKDRPYLYWANLKYLEIITSIQSQINLPINTDTFVSVRKDLYSNESNFSVDIENLNVPYLWINGFHDFIINGSDSVLSNKKNIVTLFQSSHYPHIEENKRFSEYINEFIKKNEG